MRGDDRAAGDALFSYVSLEARVPASHPLRLIRAVVDEALEALSPRFEELYARTGRPSVPPEKLILALHLLNRLPSGQARTVGADRGYDTRGSAGRVIGGSPGSARSSRWR